MWDEILLLILFLLKASATTSSLVTSKAFTRMTDMQCSRYYFYKTGWFPRSENCLRACVLEDSCATVNVVPTPSPVGVQCDFMSAIAPMANLFASAGSECYTVRTSCVKGYCKNGAKCVPGLYPHSPVSCSCLTLPTGIFRGGQCETFAAWKNSEDILIDFNSQKNSRSRLFASNLHIVYAPDQDTATTVLLVKNGQMTPSYISTLDQKLSSCLDSSSCYSGWTVAVVFRPVLKTEEIVSSPIICFIDLISERFSIGLRQSLSPFTYTLYMSKSGRTQAFKVYLDQNVFTYRWWTLMVGQDANGDTWITISNIWSATVMTSDNTSFCQKDRKDTLPTYMVLKLRYWNRFLGNSVLPQVLE